MRRTDPGCLGWDAHVRASPVATFVHPQGWATQRNSFIFLLFLLFFCSNKALDRMDYGYN
jgi:hypothetical protein